MSFTVIIPARFSSSRLPGKPLLEINGKPMIQHVYERACASEARAVIVATDDQRIAEAATAFGADVCVTSADHPSGTDRLQEVVRQRGFYADDIVVNVQGDEPMIPPRIINQVAHNLAAEPRAVIATLSEPVEDTETLLNPNAVKVVSDAEGRALYFSRAPIPWPRDAFAGDELPAALPTGFDYQRHIGIYAYRVKLLNDFVRWPSCELERTESLEQLRALWNGAFIHVDRADEAVPAGVDTLDDLEQVRRHMATSAADA
ncbi:3-deoxy-manno-octulosonate cytidylyltransferase [Motiliproteus sediminis]|uniref:3-deoxy-manno-octulosonate cytidylyltransferase n=1 Tax=Motiliproteus sediminis TaxID=1468178 RepID=UPI001AF0050A|nr:3-deoxy-manno-octulosonate cytidylyltransferase [Motiliproteus sediminis]